MPAQPRRTPAPTATATPQAAPVPANGRRAIRIRMYRVGFGDCFLLTLPADRDRHVLIDCGVHSQGDIGTIGDAVADIAKVTGNHLDLVIATHAHQDHISGFSKCQAVFAAFTVGEVWLPWTENPADPVATQLRQKREAVTQQLAMHFAAAAPGPEAMAAVQNLVGNEAALKSLKSGITGGRVTYMKAGGVLENAAGIPGLTSRLLGPPTDQTFLARMDPPSGDRFLRAADGGGAEPANPIRPFEEFWTASAPDNVADLLPPKDAETLRSRTQDMEGLAFSLTNAMNNTSVVTLFSFAGQNLLFPGDAQYGNWQSWIDDPSAKAILDEVDFYKVAHHGSVNATPKSAVEAMSQGRFAAMVSTQSKPWPSIPYGKLLEALMQRSCGVARSDGISLPRAPAASDAPPPIFTRGPIWVDYEIRI